MLAVKIEHANPFYDDSYAVNSQWPMFWPTPYAMAIFVGDRELLFEAVLDFHSDLGNCSVRRLGTRRFHGSSTESAGHDV
jgi:hypothetical protein